MGLSFLALMAAPELAHAAPVDLFYERTVMTAVGQRCALFDADTAQALAAAGLQARGAALRAGSDPATLAAVGRDARARGAGADCSAAGTALAAARVRSAFAGFAKVTRLAYPGQMADWRADRTLARDIRWRLVQETRFGPDRMSFGLAGLGSPSVLLAVGRFADNAQPYSARLLLRDQSRTSGPYLNQQGGSAAKLPLPRRMPPRDSVVTFSAKARSPAGVDLLPKGAAWGWAFRFPDAAARALAGLDPREAVAVEFVFPDDSVRRAYVEVGDFAAGQAFLQLAGR
jgi:hypothetical protein